MAKKRMVITIATKEPVDSSSTKYITNVDETGELFYGIKNGDTIYVTEIGPVLGDDVEDANSVAHHNPIYLGYDLDQVKHNLELSE